ncbi:hypothetical protein GOP47_0016737 [Adiantum capillus-veneris]|uniref:Uncharacterized protein n=1 Tax=Adiantum capillus-veneris TaxID=13818 RepID=A0A9D4ZC00_ADICA|nr:hypothetical protein GOP47_0016737 [Adiantum capillus-veneris]
MRDPLYRRSSWSCKQLRSSSSPSLLGKMTASETCALPGCSKPPFPSLGRATRHSTCGNLHHQLLMAERFHSSLPHPHQQILDRNSAGLCALPSCCDPPYPSHAWCSRSHYLVWLSDFTSRLCPDQRCKLPGCTRHVFVDENSTPSQYCGWRHCQEHVMLVALQRQHQQPPQQASLPSSAESKCVHVPSLDSLVPALREYSVNLKSPRNIQVDEDFFLKHPWDICAANGHTCFLIVRCNYKSNGKRLMLTKDGYHWKQQGRAVKKNRDYVKKYFTYEKQKGKNNDGVKYHDGCTYSMDECTVEDTKDYALVKLHKRTTARGKQLKGQLVSDGQQSVAEVNDICIQKTTRWIWALSSGDISA